MKKQISINPIPEYIYQYFKKITMGVDFGKDISQWILLWYEGNQFIYKIPGHTSWAGRFCQRQYRPPEYFFTDLQFSKGGGYILYLSSTILKKERRINLEDFIKEGKEKVELLLQKQHAS